MRTSEADGITCAEDVLPPTFHADAAMLATSPCRAGKAYREVVAYDRQTGRELPGWVYLLALSYGYADCEELPEAWWIAAAGHLPLNPTRFDRLCRKARRAITAQIIEWQSEGCEKRYSRRSRP